MGDNLEAVSSNKGMKMLKNVRLAVFGFFALILSCVYLWASPDRSWSGVIWMMMAISLGSLYGGINLSGASMSRTMTLAMGFLFYIGTIFVLIRAEADAANTKMIGEIITTYPNTTRISLIPPNRKRILKAWSLKTDDNVRKVREFYSDEDKIAPWEVIENSGNYIKLEKGSKNLSIKLEHHEWTYANFTLTKNRT